MICNLERVKRNYDPDKKRLYRKAHYLETAAEQRQRCREWHARNSTQRAEQRRRRRIENNDVRAKDRARVAQYRATDPQWRVKKALRARLGSAIKRKQKSGSAISDLGCSVEYLMSYLAGKFGPEMSWDNWPSVWQIDHIMPLASFDLTDRTQFLAACHYTNLQPLTISDHKQKHCEAIAALREAAE